MFMIISQHYFCQIHGYSLRPWCFDDEHDAHWWTRLRVLHPQRVCNPCLRLDYGRGEEVWFEALWVLRPASSENRKVLRLLGSGSLTLTAHICSCLNGKSDKKNSQIWLQDLDSYTTPMECGRAFRCKMKSDTPFIGREALQAQVADFV